MNETSERGSLLRYILDRFSLLSDFTIWIEANRFSDKHSTSNERAVLSISMNHYCVLDVKLDLHIEFCGKAEKNVLSFKSRALLFTESSLLTAFCNMILRNSILQNFTSHSKLVSTIICICYSCGFKRIFSLFAQ